MAAAVSGIDLNRALDAATRSGLLQTLHKSLVLCIRDQSLAPVAFRGAMTMFGTPVRRAQITQHRDCADVNIISSSDRDELGDGGRLVNVPTGTPTTASCESPARSPCSTAS